MKTKFDKICKNNDNNNDNNDNNNYIYKKDYPLGIIMPPWNFWIKYFTNFY